MFETKSQKPISRQRFRHRMLRTLLTALSVGAISLLIGMCGYHFLETLPWSDSFLNASMILGGMGPVDPMKTESGKIFAGCYALYSGLFLVAMMALMLTPVFHRILHTFHEDDK